MIALMRSFLAGLAVLAACLLAPLAVVSPWVAGVASDTDEYVAVVGPLAKDPAVQDAVADRISAEIAARLGTTIGSDVTRRAAGIVVESPVFEPAWRGANEQAHREAVAILEGERTSDDGTVRIELGGLAQAMTGGLTQLGVPAAGLETIAPSFTVARSQDLEKAQEAYELTEAAGYWLPYLWVMLAAVALLFAHRRLKTAAWLAFGSAVTLGILAGFLLGSGGVVAGEVPPRDEDLARAVWDAVIESLQDRVHVMALGALGAAVVLGLLALVAGRRTASH